MSEPALDLIKKNMNDYMLRKDARYLNLDSCNITKLPDAIEDLVWVEIVVLRNIEKLNDISSLARLIRLQEVYLYNSGIKNLDPLSGLKNLQILSCSNTLITDLSPLQNLTNLREFYCRHTNVTDISPLSGLNHLERIDCSYTKITNLLPLLPKIKKGLPVRWSFLEYGVCVENCPLTIPPPEIVKQGNYAILNYFYEKEQQGTVKGCEAKMLLVGEGGSGKTSLLRRLYQTTKPLPEENESTKGIDIYRHDFKMADGNDFRLNVWDFGGQEIYHATHQFFLTKRSLYVLLDDTRKDHKTVHDDGFKYWLEAVDLLGGHSPVLIFQNEKSNRSKKIDIGGIKGKFDNVQGVWKGNLEHPGTADKLRDAVEHFAKNLPHVGEELPAKWVSIRAELEEIAKTEPYITQQEYFKVYGRHLELNRTKAMHLSQYLHDLGVFLHFQDDTLLARTVILQNVWATEAVFKMLDDEMVKGKLGRFTEADCQRVWSDSTWADMHPELLALMQKFELCYVLPDAQPKTWLVPQLLLPSKPAELANWAKPGDLVLRYRYEFLPKGLVSRLMVRQHRFVPRPDMAWTSGVLFERDDSQVLVEIPPKGGEIALRARGHERKELLSVIAADLDALNESFHGLQERVTKLIPCNCAKCLTLAEPEFFAQKRLLQRKRDGKLKVECPGSYEPVEVLELLDGVNVEHLPDWAKENKSAVSPEIFTIIRELVEENETQNALEEFKKVNPKEAVILLSNFKELKTKHSRGVLKEEDFLREKAKINSGLLDLLDS
ncbi:MAG: leucine-rich repeat domain-containing protein [Saprospiraceae bacterium]|nr:leucine-rich repeat domain-containing protein [Saprospiraceae bacterium]